METEVILMTKTAFIRQLPKEQDGYFPIKRGQSSISVQTKSQYSPT